MEKEKVTSNKGNKTTTREGFQPRGDFTQSERKAETQKEQELIELTRKHFDSEEIRNRLKKVLTLEFQVGRFTAFVDRDVHSKDKFIVNYFKGQNLIASVTWGRDPRDTPKAIFHYFENPFYDFKNHTQEVEELLRVLRTERAVIVEVYSIEKESRNSQKNSYKASAKRSLLNGL